MEKLKAIMEEKIEDPLVPEEEKIRADTSINIPNKEDEIENSVASSIGSPLPAKNILNKSHDRIKKSIPVLDFTKIKGRSDLQAKKFIASKQKVGGEAQKALAKSFVNSSDIKLSNTPIKKHHQ